MSVDRLEEVPRKSRVLRRASFGCLRQTWVVNITQGCMLGCVYCYARSYANAPPKGTVLLYADLPEKLAEELDSPRRRAPVKWVSFNTASDSFQPHPRVQEVTREAIDVLLKRGVGLAVLTKGWISRSSLELLASRPDLVYVRVGLISLDPKVHREFEPGTAPPAERLRTIERLRQAGIRTSVQVDPILPFVTDTEQGIEELLVALADRSIRRATLSYLHLRPRIVRQLQRELNGCRYQLLWSCFQGRALNQPITGGGTTCLLPAGLRQRGYERFRRLAARLGIAVHVCACKNPDIPADRCMTEMWGSFEHTGRARKADLPRQLSLFKT
jgi:DNA repair photolyase